MDARTPDQKLGIRTIILNNPGEFDPCGAAIMVLGGLEIIHHLASTEDDPENHIDMMHELLKPVISGLCDYHLCAEKDETAAFAPWTVVEVVDASDFRAGTKVGDLAVVRDVGDNGL